MATTPIVISDTQINFPTTSADPTWSEALLLFAQTVEGALDGLTSSGDINKLYYTLTSSHNPVSNLDIPSLAFDFNVTRAAFVRYYVYRNTSLTTVVEAGLILLCYNAANSTNNKWQINTQKVGNASCTFSITDNGQMQLTTTTLSGTGHTGVVGYTAQVLNVP